MMPLYVFFWAKKTQRDHGPGMRRIHALPKNRYFYFDEATDTAIELLDRGPRWLARLFAVVAGLLIVASVFL